jgi:hypothetical protein
MAVIASQSAPATLGVPGVARQVVLNARDYGALGDGTSDDTAALQAWINAAISTQQPGWLPAGTYKITDALTIGGACTLQGAGVTENWGSFATFPAGGGTLSPNTVPYLSGAVIQQSAQNKDGLLITVVGKSVNLRDFGLLFATNFVSTGHGINCQPPLKTSYADSGVTASKWENIAVFGHDGNHYAYHVVNPQIVTRIHCRSYGGGGLYLRSESDVGYYYGNWTDIHPYHVVLFAGSAHGYELSSLNLSCPLDMLCFVRPQGWVIKKDTGVGVLPGTTPPTLSQKTLKSDDAYTYSVTLVAPDLEENVGSVPTFPSDNFAIAGFPYVAGQSGGPNGPMLGYFSLASFNDTEGFFCKSGGQDVVRSYWTLVLNGNCQGAAPLSLGSNPSAASTLAVAQQATSVPLAARGAASQTADLLQAQDSAAHTQFALANVGSGGAPVWALRLRGTANAESAAQAHTAGAATGKAIQVVDDSGATIGWLNLTA